MCWDQSYPYSDDEKGKKMGPGRKNETLNVARLFFLFFFFSFLL